jgi:phenylpyruvate tautomerase PptA (4-oxalocrotonate tautomerase family)
MPLVKVHLREGRPPQDKAAIAAGIQSALVEVLEVPEADRYQLFAEYGDDDFRHTEGYLGLAYTRRLLMIEITIVDGRDGALKRALLAAINRNLVAAGLVGPDDVFVLVYEIGRPCVSFGQGLAQRAQ